MEAYWKKKFPEKFAKKPNSTPREIIKQEQADSIYDTCVNMGIKTGIKLTQRTLEIVETGIMNNETLNKLNS